MEANRSCFVLTLWPLCKGMVTESGAKVEVNSAYKQGRYGRMQLKSLHIMSVLNIMLCRMDGQTDNSWLSGRTNKTDYTDPYVTHINKTSYSLYIISVYINH